MDKELTRRDVLRGMGRLLTIVGLTAACTPSSPPESLNPQSDHLEPWQESWQQTIGSAKKEGQLLVSYTLSRGSPRPAFDEFERAFPGISVDYQEFTTASLLVPKIIQEQKAGIYSWDLCFLTGARLVPQLRDGGALDPLKPVIFHPEALSENSWYEGFEGGFLDKEKELAFATALNVEGQTWINTDQVKDGELKTVEDLLDSKWRGKIAISSKDSGFTISPAASLRLQYGDGYLKRLFVDQQPTPFRDNYQIADGLVRGKFALGLGVVTDDLEKMQAAGVGFNVKPTHLSALEYLNKGSIITLLRHAPHPHTAKLFINWFLTREGQTAFVKSTRINSRRADVPAGNSDTVYNPNIKLAITLGPEENNDYFLKTQALLYDLIQ